MAKTTAELIAEFEANGGKARKVSADATAGYTPKEWYKMARGTFNGMRDESLTDGARELQRGREEAGYYKS